MGKHRKQNFRTQRKSKKSEHRKVSKRTKQAGTPLPTCGGHFQVPWEVYHGVPVGWTKAEIVAAHHRLGGVYSIDGNSSPGRGVRELTADEGEWFGYKRALYKIADGVRAHDPACIELAVRYIELRFIGSYSGYIRARLARRLKHVDLNERQQERLMQHFEAILNNRDFTAEFRDYEKLWKCIAASRNGKAKS